MTPTANKRSFEAKNTAIKEIGLLFQAIDNNQLKEALYHEKLASAAVDEILLSSKLVDGKTD